MAEPAHRRAIRGPLLVFLVGAVVIEIVWTIFLGLHLPRHYVAIHWDMAWVGLDVMEIAMLVLTAWAAWRMRAVFIIFASVTGTLFIVDAWFDVTTARRGDLDQSVWLALITEIPIAVALFWSAWRATQWFITDPRAAVVNDITASDEFRSDAN
jgi:hypothetical protein